MLHYLFIYYQKDPTIMERLKEILDKMCDLAPKHIDPLDMKECLEMEDEAEDEAEDADEYDPETDGDGGMDEMLE
jgi:hypothetical protein